MKTAGGRFFEDYRLGETIAHAVPRTLGPGEAALYRALYPARHALHSSAEFAARCGLAAPLDDLIVFHTVFGKSVPDISRNAVANLGYAEGRWLRPVPPGATLTATSQVIGLRQTSKGDAGVVWVRTIGHDAQGAPVLEFVRWVLVRKRDAGAPAPPSNVPELESVVDPGRLVLPPDLSFADYDFAQAGDPHRLTDYAIGERIDHVERVTIEEAEHMMATRLWQNTAAVHFDATARDDGRRLVYGGHVMSLARALSFNGLANMQLLAALNAGTHANPCFAGDTVAAWSEVLDKAETDRPGVGAIRIRLVAYRVGECAPFALKDDAGRHLPGVLLDLDLWGLMPA